MVNRLHISELISIGDAQERNIAIRHAFASFTQPVDITGSETNALIILLNLTYSKKDIDDVLDKALARKTLKNKRHIDNCINEVQWFHSHNLKYPDIRVSKQRLVAPPITLQRSVLTSANCEKSLGWSHDSAKVNLAKLFVSPFYWEGKVYCLATALDSAPKQWKLAFTKLGMPVKEFLNLCTRVKDFLPEEHFPEQLDKHSPQERFPYQDKYLSITPVVSHALQSEIQQITSKKECRYTLVNHAHSSSVSELTASALGGK